MLYAWPKSYHLIMVILLATFGYLGYQVSEYRTGPDERVTYFLENTEIIQRRQLRDLPETTIPFYGDSLVHGLAVSRADSSLENFGIGHDYSENLLNRVREDLQYRQFLEYAVAIGINDLGRGVTVGDLYQKYYCYC
ncbi:MAG: hypothetical protein MH219_16495 [Marinobacter sp.]|nr:hypothetical protein [Marinobacter sp.]